MNWSLSNAQETIDSLKPRICPACGKRRVFIPGNICCAWCFSQWDRPGSHRLWGFSAWIKKKRFVRLVETVASALE